MFTDNDGLWNDRRPARKAETRRAEKSTRNASETEEAVHSDIAIFVALADEARINSFQFSQLTNGMLRTSVEYGGHA